MEAGVTVNAVRSLSHGQHPNHRANWPYFPNVRIHADHLKWYPYKTLIRVRKKKEEEESEDFQGGEASLEREQKGGTKNNGKRGKGGDPGNSKGHGKSPSEHPRKLGAPAGTTESTCPPA